MISEAHLSSENILVAIDRFVADRASRLRRWQAYLDAASRR